MKPIWVVLLLSVSLAGQVTAPTTKPIAASDFGRWTIPSATPVASAGVRTVQLQFSSATASSGPSFPPVTLNTPLLIVDQGHNETVIPSAVSCPQGGVLCTFTANFAQAHAGNFLVSSGTFGLQEAINYLLGNNGGTVQITSDWPGTAGMITSASGGTNVSLQDIRNGLTVYTFQNGAYAPPAVVNSNPGFLCGTTPVPGLLYWDGTQCQQDGGASFDSVNIVWNFEAIVASGTISALKVATSGAGGVVEFNAQSPPISVPLNKFDLFLNTNTGLVDCLNNALTHCLGAVQNIATGTAALPTSAIASGACASTGALTATGVVSTDTISVSPNTDPTAITGYAASASGSLYVQAFPGANVVTFKVCNNTSGTITPSALSLNWAVRR